MRAKAKLASRCGNIAQEIAKLLKLLLPIAAVNLFSESCQNVCRNIVNRCIIESQKQTVKSSGGIKDRTNAVSRKDTICSQMNDNVHFYVAQKSHDVTNFISDWLEIVHDFNNSDTNSLEVTF